jgi:hypothetical protein
MTAADQQRIEDTKNWTNVTDDIWRLMFYPRYNTQPNAPASFFFLSNKIENNRFENGAQLCIMIDPVQFVFLFISLVWILTGPSSSSTWWGKKESLPDLSTNFHLISRIWICIQLQKCSIFRNGIFWWSPKISGGYIIDVKSNELNDINDTIQKKKKGKKEYLKRRRR